MKYATLTDNAYVLRLERGDDIPMTINAFCQEQGIANAQITGLGSVENPVLAHYSIETRQFTQKDLPGIYEITSLTGNVGLVDSQPSAHLHANISDETMAVHGGHLISGSCSATLELIITAYSSQHSKAFDEAIGLNVWDF